MISRRSILAGLALIPGAKLLGIAPKGWAHGGTWGFDPSAGPDIIGWRAYDGPCERPIAEGFGWPPPHFIIADQDRQYPGIFEVIVRNSEPIDAQSNTSGATEIEARTNEINGLGSAPSRMHSLKKGRGGGADEIYISEEGEG